MAFKMEWSSQSDFRADSSDDGWGHRRRRQRRRGRSRQRQYDRGDNSREDDGSDASEEISKGYNQGLGAESADTFPNVDPDEKMRVFKFLLNNFNGRTKLGTFMSKKGNLLQGFTYQQAASWMKHSKDFRVSEKQEQIKWISISSRKASVCFNYRDRNTEKCHNQKCRFFHVCRAFVSGFCPFGLNCGFSHSFLDGSNAAVSAKLALQDFENEQIRIIVFRSIPVVCDKFNKGGCNEDCPDLHVCAQFIGKKCLDEDCKYGHELRGTEHNDWVLSTFCLQNMFDSTFNNIVITHWSDSAGSCKLVPAGAGRKMKTNSRALGAKESLNQKKRTNSATAFQKDQNSTAERGKGGRQQGRQNLPASHYKELCEKHTWAGTCEEGASCPRYHHPHRYPFVWQLHMHDTWHELSRVDSLDIEEHFCALAAQGNFEGSLQYTLEEKFLRGQQKYYFEHADGKRFLVLFKEMKIINLEMGATYSLLRRPFQPLVDHGASVPLLSSLLLDKPPTIHQTDLPVHWCTVDRYQNFELVELTATSAEYVDVEKSFHSTMPRNQATIVDIFRVQNPSLWDKFCSAKRSMAPPEGSVEEVEERQLFHGTPALLAARGICTNGFDFRRAGQNVGVKFGRGSYFSTMAWYSHNYTQSPDRFMFQARVLVGEYTKGDPSYTSPPPCEGLRLYGSCVNDEDNPTIFVIFDLAQSYPEYLIQYTDAEVGHAHSGLSHPAATTASSYAGRGKTHQPSAAASASYRTMPTSGSSTAGLAAASSHTTPAPTRPAVAAYHNTQASGRSNTPVSYYPAPTTHPSGRSNIPASYYPAPTTPIREIKHHCIVLPRTHHTPIREIKHPCVVLPSTQHTPIREIKHHCIVLPSTHHTPIREIKHPCIVLPSTHHTPIRDIKHPCSVLPTTHHTPIRDIKHPCSVLPTTHPSGISNIPVAYYPAPTTHPSGRSNIPASYYPAPTTHPSGRSNIPASYYPAPTTHPSGRSNIPASYYPAPTTHPSGRSNIPASYYPAPTTHPSGRSNIPASYYPAPTTQPSGRPYPSYSPPPTTQSSGRSSPSYSSSSTTQPSGRSSPSYSPPPTTQPSGRSFPSYSPPPTTQPSVASYIDYSLPPTTQPSVASYIDYSLPPTTQPSVASYIDYSLPPTTQPSVASYIDYSLPPTTQP